MKRALRPAVFVDKDGTLVENVPYNVDPALLRFQPGAREALAALSAQGFAIAVVSNQSGVARGYFSSEDLARVCRALQHRLRQEAGVDLIAFAYCPHAPDAGCACRKPRPGMLLDAAWRHGLDLQRSWMVGDTLDDVEAGRRSGCRSILYDSGGETEWRDGPWRRPHARVSEWDEAAHLMLWAATHGPHVVRRSAGGPWLATTPARRDARFP